MLNKYEFFLLIRCYVRVEVYYMSFIFKNTLHLIKEENRLINKINNYKKNY